MLTTEQARELALALPEAIEQDHHGRPSFRVADKIFATLWDAEHMNVMLDEPGIRTAVQAHPDCCSEVFWASGCPPCASASPTQTARCSRSCSPTRGSARRRGGSGPPVGPDLCRRGEHIDAAVDDLVARLPVCAADGGPKPTGAPAGR